MTHTRMHLYPPPLPTRLRVEVACAIARDGTARPAEVPFRARRSQLDPPFPGGPFVDVLLEASAYPASSGARTARVRAAIGDWSWEAHVEGRRIATRVADTITISRAEEIDTPVPIALDVAFGGGTSEAAEGLDQLERDLSAGHLYPRNPFGTGYRPGREDGIWGLPQLEDPDDRLTPERLLQIEDEGWTTAPLPWCLDEIHTATFPRVAMIAGMGPQLEPGAALTEVRRGLLVDPLPAPDSLQLDPRFLQDAPPWGWLPALRPDDAIVLESCLPRGETFSMMVGDAPVVRLALDGSVTDLELRASRVVLRPELGDVLVVWLADVALPRPFVPGVHRTIPIELRLAGADPVPYPTPAVALGRSRS